MDNTSRQDGSFRRGVSDLPPHIRTCAGDTSNQSKLVAVNA